MPRRYLPATGTETYEYVEQDAQSVRMAVGLRSHHFAIEVYNTAEGEATAESQFRLFGVQAESRVRRPGAEHRTSSAKGSP